MNNDKPPTGISFAEIMDGIRRPAYPAWRYHPIHQPRLVYNTEQDEEAARQNWGPPYEPITSTPGIANYFHDLEDFNERQLVLYAKEEFGVTFPKEADKETLIGALWELYKISPKHKGRMVLLAQSIAMNYDETLKTIQRKAENFEQWETKEVTLG